MGRIVVYTCITGKYDWLLPPLVDSPGIDFFCFTDSNHFNVKGWKLLSIPSFLSDLPPNLINRYIKIFPNKFFDEYDWSIYVDGNLRITGNLGVLVEELERSGDVLGCPKHPERSNIFEEASACKSLGKFSKEDLSTIDFQLKDYLRKGMPRDQPLTENNIIIRKHSSLNVQCLMDYWWDHLSCYTKRDQISFPYVIWSQNISMKRFTFSANVENGLVRKVNHRDNRSKKMLLKSYIFARRYDHAFYRYLYSSGKFFGRCISVFKK